MPSDVRSKTKPPGVTDPARATPAFFVGASFWDSSPDADPDARLYDRAPHPVQIGDSGPPGLMVDRRQIAGSACVLDLLAARSVRPSTSDLCVEVRSWLNRARPPE
jgi:hypothetical protein